MSKRLRMALVGLVTLLLVLIAPLVFRPSEPRYEGRYLSEWLEESPLTVRVSAPPAVAVVPTAAYRVGSLRAAHALRAMGTNACPALVKIIRTPDSRWKTSLIQWSRRQSWLKLRWQTSGEKRLAAFAALYELGPAAAPAVVELLCDETLPPASQAHCFQLVERIGKEARPALPALLRMVEERNTMGRLPLLRLVVIAGSIDLSLVVLATTTNANPVARSNAVTALSKLEEPARRAAGVLISALSHSDGNARIQAVQFLARSETDLTLRLILTLLYADPKTKAGTAYSLGHVGQRPELSVPVLTDCLTDPNASVRQAAATALGEFGRHAEPAVSHLKQLLNDPKRGVREAALNALEQIDLSRAADSRK